MNGLSGTGSWAEAGSVEDAVMGADAVLVLTEWQHYRELNWSDLAGRMRKPAWVFDARAVADPAEIKRRPPPLACWRRRIDGSHCFGHRSCRFYRCCPEPSFAPEGDRVVGVDNLNDYDPSLKQAAWLRQIEAVAPEVPGGLSA